MDWCYICPFPFPFHWSGKIPVSRMLSKMILNGTHRCSPQSFDIRIYVVRDMIFFPVQSRNYIANFKRTNSAVCTEKQCWSSLSFESGVHCEEKKILKIEAFSLQSVINLSCTNKGGILRINHLTSGWSSKFRSQIHKILFLCIFP